MHQVSINLYETPTKAQLDAKLFGQKELQVKTANIVEGMTTMKRTGVVLELIDQEGNRYFTKLTARIVINGIAAAVRGFMQRVKDNPDQA